VRSFIPGRRYWGAQPSNKEAHPRPTDSCGLRVNTNTYLYIGRCLSHIYSRLILFSSCVFSPTASSCVSLRLAQIFTGIIQGHQRLLPHIPYSFQLLWYQVTTVLTQTHCSMVVDACCLSRLPVLWLVPWWRLDSRHIGRAELNITFVFEPQPQELRRYIFAIKFCTLRALPSVLHFTVLDPLPLLQSSLKPNGCHAVLHFLAFLNVIESIYYYKL
jgi:hypothetical protein